MSLDKESNLVLGALRGEISKLASMKKADVEDFAMDSNSSLPDPEEESFLVSKTYDVVTPESAEQGDFSDNGFVFQDEVMDRSDVVRELRRGGYIEPSASFLSGLRWVSTEGEQDYTDGSSTTYSLHIKDIGGAEIGGSTWKSLLEEAGLFSGMHLSSAKVASYGDADESFESEYEEPVACPQCGGPAGTLGTLGSTKWMSCRNCGAEFQDHTASRKKADATEPVTSTDASEAPNTFTAKKDHPEFIALAEHIRALTKDQSKTDFDPNDPKTD